MSRFRFSSGSGPTQLGAITFADLDATVVNTDATRTVNGIRFISAAASASQTVSFGGGEHARKTAGNSGVRLLIPMSDLGYTADYARRPLCLVTHHPSGLGRSDSSGVVGITVGFDTDSSNPFNTANWHGSTDLGRWFARNNFSGSGDFTDVVGASGAPFTAVLSSTNRVYASALYTHGFNSALKISAPSSTDPGVPSGPHDSLFSGPYSNGFRQADDDTLFTQGSDALRPFIILNFGALTQDSSTDTPNIGSLSLWALEPEA